MVQHILTTTLFPFELSVGWRGNRDEDRWCVPDVWRSASRPLRICCPCPRRSPRRPRPGSHDSSSVTSWPGCGIKDARCVVNDQVHEISKIHWWIKPWISRFLYWTGPNLHEKKKNVPQHFSHQGHIEGRCQGGCLQKGPWGVHPIEEGLVLGASPPEPTPQNSRSFYPKHFDVPRNHQKKDGIFALLKPWWIDERWLVDTGQTGANEISIKGVKNGHMVIRTPKKTVALTTWNLQPTSGCPYHFFLLLPWVQNRHPPRDQSALPRSRTSSVEKGSELTCGRCTCGTDSSSRKWWAVSDQVTIETQLFLSKNQA